MTIPSHNACRNNTAASLPHRGRILECGTSLHKLSDLQDYRSGVYGAMAPRTAEKLENHITHCPQCRHFLAQLDRLHNNTRDMFHNDVSNTSADLGWLQPMLDALSLEVRQGALIPLEPLFESDSLHLSEGAIRSLLRTYGSSSTALVSSTEIVPHGDLTAIGTPIEINVDIVVSYPTSPLEQALHVRDKIWMLLKERTDLLVTAVNVHVCDIIVPQEAMS
ncbi:MAG: hypothetical protein Q4P66_07235 [Actinomycetaceae bacterium]|nr:hypothetical protein [Actinomycetaceae bacterium]